MPDVASFEEIRSDFEQRVRKLIWATVATVGADGGPRTRIMHPVWEGATGYIGTLPDTLLSRQIAGNPRVSLSYADPMDAVYVQAHAAYLEDSRELAQAWELFKSHPEPYGFDPATIHPLWAEGPDAPGWAVIRLTPSRIELFTPPAKLNSRIWRA